MRMYDLILKKRQGKPLTKDEIQWMIREYTDGRIPDYQMSALLMAICFQGLDKEETYELTMAMARSGEMLDLSQIQGIKVDKHSTGGVGDKTSLALTPIVASLGIPVAKMSGRGLGHTGGTIDKLESIPGFSTQLEDDAFEEQVNSIGISIMGQTKDLAPADKLLYALRDVTATVDQISLIASSIMSKKLAAGADAILLDVKTGSGAFMKEESDAIQLAKEMVDIVHEYGKEAMMFMGDHWIGMEPFMDEFASIGLDAVVGSVGNGATLRLFSDIKNVKYTEGRFLPYFFPDTFHEGGDPVKEAKVNWVTARRAILRSPIQRIGYGGYLKLALEFPDFVQYIKEVCEEFRTLYDNIQGTTPYCVKRVAVLNCWGKMRSWGNHMVHHAIYYKQNYSYFGIIEALSGAPFDVSFISFDDIKADKDILKKFDVVINVGDADTAQSGGENWIDETIITAVREFVYNGGGFIGVGEPAAHQWQGRFIQLDDVLGVEEEHGFNLNTDKYNWEEHRDHFILKDAEGEVDFGEGKKNIYALPETEILIQKDQEVQMAVKTFGKGRGVYISGLPYSFKNSRVLYRAVLWSASAEEELHCWYSTNYNVEVHAYVKNGKYCVVNNTYEPQDTVVYRGDGSSFRLHMEANEIKWYQI